MRVRQRVTVGQGCGIEVASFTGGDEISAVIIKLLLADTLIYKETMTSYGKKTTTLSVSRLSNDRRAIKSIPAFPAYSALIKHVKLHI